MYMVAFVQRPVRENKNEQPQVLLCVLKPKPAENQPRERLFAPFLGLQHGAKESYSSNSAI